MSLLSDTRERARALRVRVKEHNRRRVDDGPPIRLVFYAGQTVMGLEEEEQHAS